MFALESVVRDGNRVDLFTRGPVDISERKKKIGTPGCLWDTSLGENFLADGEWLKAGGLARVGVSAAVICTGGSVGPQAVMSRFDSGHPTAAGKLSPPAGIWESGSLLNAALMELGEEVIAVVGEYIVPWEYDGEFNYGKLEPDHIQTYADDHEMQVSEASVIWVEDFEDGGQLDIEAFEVYVDGVRQGRAVLACEPENGGIEVIFLLRCRQAVFERLLDGERFKGEWLHREVGLWTAEALEDEYQRGALTTKAIEVMGVMKGL
jgi:hypothetical protein